MGLVWFSRLGFGGLAFAQVNPYTMREVSHAAEAISFRIHRASKPDWGHEQVRCGWNADPSQNGNCLLISGAAGVALPLKWVKAERIALMYQMALIWLDCIPLL